MSTNEIILLLKAHVDKTVKITYASGEIDMALIQFVDDEGAVYDLASLRPDERKTACWTAFQDILEVQAMDSPENQKRPIPE